jgi:hypothetical protein
MAALYDGGFVVSVLLNRCIVSLKMSRVDSYWPNSPPSADSGTSGLTALVEAPGKAGLKGELETVSGNPATFSDREIVVSGKTVALGDCADV